MVMWALYGVYIGFVQIIEVMMSHTENQDEM